MRKQYYCNSTVTNKTVKNTYMIANFILMVSVKTKFFPNNYQLSAMMSSFRTTPFINKSYSFISSPVQLFRKNYTNL